MWEPKLELLTVSRGLSLAQERAKQFFEYISGQEGITTSKDNDLVDADLSVPELAKGVEQHQVPLFGSHGDTFFITRMKAHAVFPLHVHSESSVFRIVTAGTVWHENVELGVGDWMYVPVGCPYELSAGQDGVTMLHRYGVP